MGQLRLALRPFGRADASLPEAHGRQTLPVRRLLALLLPIRPPGPAHEETPELGAFSDAATKKKKHKKTHKHCLDTHKALTLQQLHCYKLPDAERLSPTTQLLPALLFVC